MIELEKVCHKLLAEHQAFPGRTTMIVFSMGKSGEVMGHVVGEVPNILMLERTIGHRVQSIFQSKMNPQEGETHFGKPDLTIVDGGAEKGIPGGRDEGQ